LRAVAALLVIGVHATFVAGFTSHSDLGRYAARLEIGVSVFFVISGFLLYRPFALAHFGGRSRPSARTFWVRRLKRIVPAYWVAFLFVTYVLHADKVKHGWGSLAIYLGFAQIYFPSHVVSGLTQAWSLCVEMSFYLVLPLWAVLMGSKRRTHQVQLRTELAGLAGLVAFSFAFRILAAHWNGLAAQGMPTWLPAFADLFSLGMLLAVISSWLAVQDRRPAALWHPALPWVSWALAAVVFCSVSNIGLPLKPLASSPIGLSLVRQTLYGLFGFLLVVPAVFGPQASGLVRRSLQLRPIALIGVVSYGVYLWHEAWIQMFVSWTHDSLFNIPLVELGLAVTALSITSATLSYVLVERPIRLATRNRGRIAAKPAAPPATTRVAVNA
jgi:peptidoglycan/LPS O-acetylase OafA/YrhL